MPRNDKRLPPLGALRAFELSARLGTFTQAAYRLGLSQSAVTRQIAALEASLGRQVYARDLPRQYSLCGLAGFSFGSFTG